VAQGTPFLKGSFSAGDAFEQAHPALQGFIGFNIHEIGAGDPVLSNENRLFAPLDVRQEFCGPALQCGN
jgi:hypothetical protein